jgi:Putative metallopeptidase
MLMHAFSWLNNFLRAVALACAISAGPAFAQLATTTTTTPNVALNTDQFDYDYVVPKNPAHMPLYNMLREARLLEKMKEFLSPIRFPERITLRLVGCDGVLNAYFFKDEVKICYEYFEYIQKYTSKAERFGLTPKDAMVGPVVEVFLHEVGHAVVQILDIPYFGRQEDVADYFATYVLLQFAKDDARRLILGTSLLAGNEAMETQSKAPELRLLADTHSLPAQRYFNRWCMAYGADPELFGDAIELGMVPQHRARGCRYEWLTNEFAFKTLIAPYIDQKLKEKILAQPWFTFESAAVAARMSKPNPSPADEAGNKPAAFR